MDDEPAAKKLKLESSTLDATFVPLPPKKRLTVLSELIDLCSHDELIYLHSSLVPKLKRDFIAHLPAEVAIRILLYLSPCDLLTCAKISHAWRNVAEDPMLWRSLGGKDAFLRQRQIRCNWIRGVRQKYPSSSHRNPAVVTIPAHDNHVITSLELWKDCIISASDDSTMSVWKAATGQLVRHLVGHAGGVWSTTLMQDKERLISGSTDRSVRVWEIETGVCQRTLTGHLSTVRCLAGYHDLVASGSRDTSLRIWDLKTGSCQCVLQGHRAAVRAVIWLSDTRLISGSYDSTVRIWSLIGSDGRCIHVLNQHLNRVYTLATTPEFVISGSLDTTIRIWRLDNGCHSKTLKGHQSLTSGLHVLEKDLLISGNADATLRIWDLVTGTCLHVLGDSSDPNKHKSAVTSLQSVHDMVISASDDGSVKLWSTSTGKFLRDLLQLESGGHGGVVWRICASESRLVCAAGSRNGSEDTKLVILNFDPDLVSQSAHTCNLDSTGASSTLLHGTSFSADLHLPNSDSLIFSNQDVFDAEEISQAAWL